MSQIGLQSADNSPQIGSVSIPISFLSKASRLVRDAEKMHPSHRFRLHMGRRFADVANLSDSAAWGEIDTVEKLRGPMWNIIDISRLVAWQIGMQWQITLNAYCTSLRASDLDDAADDFPIFQKMPAIDRRRLAEIGAQRLEQIAFEIERREERRARVTGFKDSL